MAIRLVALNDCVRFRWHHYKNCRLIMTTFEQPLSLHFPDHQRERDVS
jgi:hypothetical protein